MDSDNVIAFPSWRAGDRAFPTMHEAIEDIRREALRLLALAEGLRIGQQLAAVIDCDYTDVP